MPRIALVGAGLVGSSWSVVFTRAGIDVAIHDPDEAATERAIAFARSTLSDLTRQNLVSAEEGEQALARLSVAKTLEQALEGAEYVQESAPERLPVKIDLYKRLDAIATPETTLASSTSGLPASSFTQDLQRRGRCLVVHPINPPHLVPLVEIVPAPWTEPSVVQRAAALMRRVGQSPITLNREINGFVVNRLQSSVLAEAFRLVEDGVCGAEDVDRAIADGLGMRWFFMGPFETIDLNAPAGIAEYCRNLGPMYYGLAQEQADPRAWSPALVETIRLQLRARTPESRLKERRAWRDEYLAYLKTVKQARRE